MSKLSFYCYNSCHLQEIKVQEQFLVLLYVDFTFPLHFLSKMYLYIIEWCNFHNVYIVCYNLNAYLSFRYIDHRKMSKSKTICFHDMNVKNAYRETTVVLCVKLILYWWEKKWKVVGETWIRTRNFKIRRREC